MASRRRHSTDLPQLRRRSSGLDVVRDGIWFASSSSSEVEVGVLSSPDLWPSRGQTSLFAGSVTSRGRVSFRQIWPSLAVRDGFIISGGGLLFADRSRERHRGREDIDEQLFFAVVDLSSSDLWPEIGAGKGIELQTGMVKEPRWIWFEIVNEARRNRRAAVNAGHGWMWIDGETK